MEDRLGALYNCFCRHYFCTSAAPEREKEDTAVLPSAGRDHQWPPAGTGKGQREYTPSPHPPSLLVFLVAARKDVLRIADVATATLPSARPNTLAGRRCFYREEALPRRSVDATDLNGARRDTSASSWSRGLARVAPFVVLGPGHWRGQWRSQDLLGVFSVH